MKILNNTFNNTNYKQNFSARLSEKEIVESVKTIIEKFDVPVVNKDADYFTKMLRGSKINPAEKQTVDEWITIKLSKYLKFNDEKEKKLSIEEIKYLENKGKKNSLFNKGKNALKNFLEPILEFDRSKHPVMKRYEEEKQNANLFKKFKDVFSSYLDLVPQQVKKTEEISLDDEIKMQLKEIYGVDLDLSKAIKTKLKEPVKTPNAEKNAPIKEPKAPKEPVNAPVINYEKNGNPKALLGIDETEGRRLFDEYKKCQKMISEFKPWEELTQEESLARSKWYREVETPLRKKIEKHNVSIIETKEFSTNPLEQVKEKREHLEDIIYKMRTNEASYYDGLLEFEKYGKRERFAHTYCTTLVQLADNFPQENVTEKTVNKFMDIYDRMAIFKKIDDVNGIPQDADWEGFVYTIEKPGVLKTEEQAERAIKICKRLVWLDKPIKDLYYNLVKNEGAVFKGNKKIEQQIRSLHQSAKELRSQYKDDFSVQLHEKWLEEHPMNY